MNAIKNFILKLINLIKSRRRLLFLILGIILIVVLALPKKNRPPSNLTTPTASKSPQTNFQQLDQTPLTNEQNTQPNEQTQAFFINKVFTKKPATGYSWLQKDLIYSTPDGIYFGSTNTQMLQQSLDYITWSRNGLAVFQSQGQWSVFNSLAKSSTPLNISGIKPLISPSGNYLASINGSSVQLLNLKSSQSESINLPTSPTWIAWPSNSSYLIAVTQNQVFIINLNDLSLQKISSSFGKFSATSPSGDYLVFSSSGTIKIVAVNDQKEVASVSFESNSNLTVNWFNQDWFLVIETSAPDKFDRRIDYLWKINNLQDKQLIANSMPITNKLNNNIPLYINSENNILPLIENNGTLWILSLVPNQFPSYTQKGFTFTPLSTRGD